MFMRRGRKVPSTRRALLVLPVWIASAIWLWSWWLSRLSDANLLLYIPLSLALFYEYAVVPSIFVYFILKAKAPKKRRPYHDKKVAIITPCVPAQESLEIIERQLKAMSAVTYPHDSWILDEGGNKKVKQLARRYKVNYFTRKNVARYNLDIYPFKAKSKAGNINAWLHKVRGKKYDFFVQMDIDHLPKPNYLDVTLGHFRDQKVGWVQAPSVYSNLDYWTARGSAEQELGLHGPLQMGFYNNVEAPVVIGSHTTFRMQAIQEIGGFQPTRAEDHLNTLALMDKGWKGVYVPEVIAEGDGPETLNAYLSQQYAWAFSMTQILKTYSFSYLKRLSTRKKLQYSFIETWYPLWSLSYFILFALPLVGLVFNTYAIESRGIDFVMRFMPAFISMMLIWWSGKSLFQPQNVSLSWRGMLLHVIRWPVILMAVMSATAGRVKPYQITPKGKFLRNVPTVKLYKPFLLLSFASALSILFSVLYRRSDTTNGFYVFATTNMVLMLSVCLLDLNIRLRQVRLKPATFRKHWLQPTMAVFSVLLIASVAFVTAMQSSKETIYALMSAPATTIEVKRDLSRMLPQLLTDKELDSELASEAYVLDDANLPNVGMHSPKVSPTNAKPYIRHTFADWREHDRIKRELLITLRSGNTPFFTIEPKGERNGKKLLEDIASGTHDQTIDAFLDAFGKTNNSVYLRFGHEMDLGNLYPWGNQDGSAYIAAYRHVVSRAQNKSIKNIKWVWGPAGVADADRYYPGDDVVDVIGTTVLYAEQFSRGPYKHSFYEFVEGRVWLQHHGKPVWITEFGADNTHVAYQSYLVREAVAQYKRYGFSALIYVNISDSNIVGPDYRFTQVDDLARLLELSKKAQPLRLPSPTATLQQNQIVLNLR